jgi:hypothetical protein
MQAYTPLVLSPLSSALVSSSLISSPCPSLPRPRVCPPSSPLLYTKLKPAYTLPWDVICAITWDQRLILPYTVFSGGAFPSAGRQSHH